MKVLIKFVWFYRGDIWRLVPELKKSFFLLCDVIITLLVLGPATRWSIEISFPTVAIAVSSLDLEALCLDFLWWIFSNQDGFLPWKYSLFALKLGFLWCQGGDCPRLPMEYAYDCLLCYQYMNLRVLRLWSPIDTNIDQYQMGTNQNLLWFDIKSM